LAEKEQRMQLIINGKAKEIAKIALDLFDDLVERKGLSCVAFVGGKDTIMITLIEASDERA